MRASRTTSSALRRKRSASTRVRHPRSCDGHCERGEAPGFSALLELFQELDLARMVKVVRGHARDHGLRRPAPDTRGERALRQILHDLAERAVLALEEGLRGGDLSRGGPGGRGKKVRACKRERSALLAREPPPHDVLPVRGV